VALLILEQLRRVGEGNHRDGNATPFKVRFKRPHLAEVSLAGQSSEMPEKDQKQKLLKVIAESYPVAEALLSRAGLALVAPVVERKVALENLLVETSLPELAAELGTGLPTLEDILEQLLRPGRDLREDLPAPILRSDVLSLEDLRPGLRLKGTVRNVVDFGAFVDIGVKTDGLLHRSQIPRGVLVKVGDVIEVEIQKVEAERGRISLGWP